MHILTYIHNYTRVAKWHVMCKKHIMYNQLNYTRNGTQTKLIPSPNPNEKTTGHREVSKGNASINSVVDQVPR